MRKYNGTAKEQEELCMFVASMMAENYADSLIIKTLADTYESRSLFDVISRVETFIYGPSRIKLLLDSVFPELASDEELSGADAVDRLNQLYKESK